MSHITKEITIQPSTIENVDVAMFRWLDEKMNIFCNTNKGWEKVQTFWAGSERFAQIKEDGEQRDKEGTIIFPRIVISRAEMNKDMGWKGVVQAHYPEYPDYKGGTLTVGKVINQDKTSNFSNAQTYRNSFGSVGKGQLNFKTKRKNPTVFSYFTMPLPVWVQLIYKISIRCEYQQQLNEIVQPFLTFTGQINGFFVENDGHRYECFLEQNFNNTNNIDSMTDEERKYESEISVKVQSYLMGGAENQEKPKIVERENAVEFKMPRERVITNDKIQHTDLARVYRT